MIRRAFIRRMMGAALASGLLGSELLARRTLTGPEPEPAVVDASEIRNDVSVRWAGGRVNVRDDASIDKWGRRVMYVDVTGERRVNTAERAEQLAIEAIRDLSMPQRVT